MGILGKLFSKREEEEFEEPLGLEEKPIVSEKHEPISSPELPSNLAEPAFTSATITPISPRDIELISSKLDTIKAILNSMDQRIASLEKAAGIEQKKMPW